MGYQMLQDRRNTYYAYQITAELYKGNKNIDASSIWKAITATKKITLLITDILQVKYITSNSLLMKILIKWPNKKLFLSISSNYENR